MNIALLGTGKEGESAKKYLSALHPDVVIAEFSDFNEETLQETDFSTYDLIVRSPSVPPRWLKNADYSRVTTATRIFFDACPAPIIGVTGTKGKGTTSSLIAALLQNLGHTIHLVGNIGTPALNELPNINASDFVVYEMSSFQLWDLQKSPHIAVILGIEPDHLNVHSDYDDYIAAKGNIARFQTPDDFCIYNSAEIPSRLAAASPAQKSIYPISSDDDLKRLTDVLAIPGRHNVENAEAALLATAAALNTSLPDLLHNHFDNLSKTFKNFKGLPHRLEFLRELNGVKYYDDNFSTNLASTRVALAAFPGQNIVLIAGGRDKTDGADLPELAKLILATTRHAVLIGESGRAVAALLPERRYTLAETLAAAGDLARARAESLVKDTSSPTIVLMSPAAASFDMFSNVYDRGAQFQKIIQELK